MNKLIRLAVLVIVAALGFGAAHGVVAETSVASRYWACKFSPAPGGVPWSNQTCCEIAGGSWVVIYDPEGEVLQGAYCDGVPGSDETYTGYETPPSTPTPRPTTGTHTTSTSGGYQQPTPTPGPTTGTHTTSTSGTYSR